MYTSAKGNSRPRNLVPAKKQPQGSEGEQSGKFRMKDSRQSLRDRAREMYRIAVTFRLHYYAAALLLVIIAFGGSTILYPPGPDQAMFMIVGKGLLKGLFPYKDIWDIKPPVVYFIYAMTIRTFGDAFISIRIFDIIYTLFTALAITWFGGKLFTWRAGFYGALCYLLMYLSQGYWELAQAESFKGLPYLISIILFIKSLESDRSWLALPAGLSLSIAVFLKYTSLALLPGFLVICLVLKPWNAKKSAATGLVFLVGLGAGISLFLAHIALNGAFQDFLMMNFKFVFPYSGLDDQAGFLKHGFSHFIWTIATGSLNFIYQVSKNFIKPNFLLCAPCVMAIYYAIWRKEKAILIPLAFAVLSIIEVVVQGKLWPYHWITAFVFLAVLGGFGFEMLHISLEGKLGKIQANLLTYLLIMLMALNSSLIFTRLTEGLNLWKLATGKISRRGYISSLCAKPDEGFCYNDFERVAQYVSRKSEPEETLYLWGTEVIIYFLADRPLATRFMTTFAVMFPWAPPEYREELMACLSSDPPSLFILEASHGTQLGETALGARQPLDGYPELTKLLNDRYFLQNTIGNFSIYRLNQEQEPPAPS
jgi:hypothetical protein